MIALNLLPDVKKQFLKAQKTRNLIFTFSLIGSAVAIGLVILGFVVVLGMRFQIDQNDEEITELQAEYLQIDNLSQILTIRNQAESLPGLHDGKPVATRLFSLLSTSTPVDVDLTEVIIDFEESTIEVTAVADDFNDVDRHVDTLENTVFVAGDSESQPVFSSIVSEQGINDNEVSFTVMMSFVPAIFDSVEEVTFDVPDIETTQSERQKPLFSDRSDEEEADNG